MRVGCVGYACEQGLGRLAKSFFDAGVVMEMMIFQHPGGRQTYAGWYPPGTPVLARRPFQGPEVDAFLKRVDVVLFFESPFCWRFVDRCREVGVKTALVPMLEWFPENPPAKFDRYLCPSLLDLDYFSAMGLPCEFIPVPVDPSTWRQRTEAVRFLHNAGHIGSRNHKGTEEVLATMQHVKSPIHLTVRGQHTSGLRRLVEAAPWVKDDPRVTIEYGEKAYETLFDGHDVYLAPEKYNGLSLPLQEACAAGLLVMASDRYPANTWLPIGPLITVSDFRKARVAGGYLLIDEAIIEPRLMALAIDEWYGGDISAWSFAGRNWANRHSWDALKQDWLNAIRRAM